MRELNSGQAIKDGYQRSGGKRVEAKMPQMSEDIRGLVEPQTQTDPSFKSSRLDCRIKGLRPSYKLRRVLCMKIHTQKPPYKP
jgi:hypothetical protein